MFLYTLNVFSTSYSLWLLGSFSLHTKESVAVIQRAGRWSNYCIIHDIHSLIYE